MGKIYDDWIAKPAGKRGALPRLVTKRPVTKSLVTEIREMASRKLGRPTKPNALSDAERQRLRRARKKAAHG